MCGIVGAVLKDGTDEALVSEMVDLISHRGPDEQVVVSDSQVTLGFARLSIIDPQEGHQPITNEDQSIQTICNGEIYNHQAERVVLAKQGHRFNSNSDAEIIPHMYEELDEAFVGRLHGMFALALFDKVNNKLILARDPLGIKPLYYLQTERGFYFSSEFKVFLLVPEYTPDVNRFALDQLLTFKHIPGVECLLNGVRVLQPGHILIFDLTENNFSIKPYYQLPENPQKRHSVSIETAQKEVSKLFDEAVRIRLMSDVPLGVALSGGLDSSAVVASAARQLNTSPKTFFVHVGDTKSEIEYARMVSDYYKTDHHEIRLEPEKLPDIVPKVMWHIEEPISVAEISTYYLGMAVSEHVKVMLCGEGADELFGGYVRFQPVNMASMLPNRILNWGYVRGLNGFTHRQRAKLYSSEQRKFLGSNSNQFLDAALEKKGETVLNKFLRYELTQQLPNHHLMRVDKLTMAHSVEARVPFLDTKLVAYVSSLPSSFKVRGFREKVLLKLAMADRLPGPIIERRKYGFSNPVKALFQTDFCDICHTEFHAQKEIMQRFFSYAAIEKLFRSIGKGFLTEPEMKLFHIYLFLKWYQVFVDGTLRNEKNLSRRLAFDVKSVEKSESAIQELTK